MRLPEISPAHSAEILIPVTASEFLQACEDRLNDATPFPLPPTRLLLERGGMPADPLIPGRYTIDIGKDGEITLVDPHPPEVN